MPHRRSRLLRLALAALLVHPAFLGLLPAAAGPPPNILLIVTDDQRANSIQRHMPIMRSRVADRGATFANAIVTTPVCCPSRASILTGRYAHSHGVFGNRVPSGFAAFDDTSTLATWLRDDGYRTGLVGKYLNGYEDVHPDGGYVPPGWDRWFAFVEPGYFDYSISDDGHLRGFGSAEEDYSTDALAGEAEAFIRDAQEPFFLLFAPNAPHGPFVPAPRHAGLLADIRTYRPPAYNERDVADKPLWIRSLDRFNASDRRMLDGRRQAQLESLLAVDEAVGRILAALRDAGSLRDTLIVFTSDNGYLWGEHRLVGKAAPYRQSHGVPLVMRLPGVIAPGIRIEPLVANIDIAPTIASAAGVSPPPVDGISLLPLIAGSGAIRRSRVLLEHGSGGGAPSYCGLRTRRSLYVRYASGEEEYYRYDLDPHELENAAVDRAQRSRVRKLRRATRRSCRPLPPGMSW